MSPRRISVVPNRDTRVIPLLADTQPLGSVEWDEHAVIKIGVVVLKNLANERVVYPHQSKDGTGGGGPADDRVAPGQLVIVHSVLDTDAAAQFVELTLRGHKRAQSSIEMSASLLDHHSRRHGCTLDSTHSKPDL